MRVWWCHNRQWCLWFRLRCANLSRHEQVVIIIKTQWHCFDQTALRLVCPGVSLGANFSARVCVGKHNMHTCRLLLHVDWFHCQQHAARLTSATFYSVCVAHTWLYINVHLVFCRMLAFFKYNLHQWWLLIFVLAIENMFYFVYGKKHTLQLTACCCTAIKGNSISCTQLYV